jgi:hypothetical protein
MPQCHNCPKPAMFACGPQNNIPLCLDCYCKLVNAQDIQSAENERMLNYLQDKMSVIAGLPPMGPRFPERRQPVHISAGTFHSINVKNSNVEHRSPGLDRSATEPEPQLWRLRLTVREIAILPGPALI